MKTVAFINEKGGTGKTTLCVNVAAYFALKRGKKVAVIDLDAQGHAGKALGLPVRSLSRTTLDFLTDPGSDLDALLQPTTVPRLWVIAANKRLADFPQTAGAGREAETLLARACRRLKDRGFDCLFIDAPPSAGLVSTNVLVASEEVIVPVALTYLALDGCAEVILSIRRVRETHPEARTRLGLVVPTMYRPTNLANEIVAKLMGYFPDRVSKTVLGFNVRIDEAQSHGQTIWQYEPQGKGALMLHALAVEIHNRVLKPPAA